MEGYDNQIKLVLKKEEKNTQKQFNLYSNFKNI